MCCYGRIKNSGGEVIPAIVSRGGYGIHATRDLFGESLFEYFLGVSEINAEAVVVYFSTSGGGIEEEITVTRLQSSLD